MANEARVYSDRHRQNDFVKKTRSAKPNSSPDILGIQKILNPTYKPWMKFIWLLISLTCISLCLYQIGLRVTEFINCPIHLDIKLQRQMSFDFPSITVCSGVFPSIIKMLVDSLDCETNNLSCSNQKIGKIFEVLNESINVNELWNYTEMRVEDLEIGTPCPMFASVSDDCHKPMSVHDIMHTETLDTIWGRCLSLTLRNKTMDYRGPFTWISIKWNYTLSPLQNQILLYFVHQEGFHHTHEAPFLVEVIQTGFANKVRITAKEYHALNTWNNPCVPENETLQCFNECVENIIEKTTPCRIPFIKSTKLSDCDTLGDIVNASRIVDKIYTSLKGDTCNCQRECHSIKYKVNVDETRANGKTYAKLILLYADDTKEEIFEKSAFSSSALISEIGGSLGLYLGISIFAIAELIEALVRRISQSLQHF